MSDERQMTRDEPTRSQADVSMPLPVVGHCSVEAGGHCVTCADEAIQVRVLRVDPAAGMALVAANDATEEIDISLVDTAQPGDLLLVHGGVALERLEEPSDERS